MTSLQLMDAPPTDFVAFLAQRGGLSPEAAASRLEDWLGEYQSAADKPARTHVRWLDSATSEQARD